MGGGAFRPFPSRNFLPTFFDKSHLLIAIPDELLYNVSKEALRTIYIPVRRRFPD